jgi:SAM-dependent methyltransferase
LARMFPETEFVGIDLSQKFLDIAQSRAEGLPNLRFSKGDSASLPLRSNEVDAARVDRSLQHMSNPRSAISEMVRVTRPGGRVVAIEPDWGTFILYNGEFDVSGVIAEEFRRSIRNPYIGRELGTLFNECGIKQIQSRIHALCLRDFESADVVFDLNRVIKRCVESRLVGDEDAKRWLVSARNASSTGAVLACLNIVDFGGAVYK